MALDLRVYARMVEYGKFDDVWKDLRGGKRRYVHVKDGHADVVLTPDGIDGIPRKPAVVLRFDTPDGQVVIVETSLAEFLRTAATMQALYPNMQPIQIKPQD